MSTLISVIELSWDLGFWIDTSMSPHPSTLSKCGVYCQHPDLHWPMGHLLRPVASTTTCAVITLLKQTDDLHQAPVPPLPHNTSESYHLHQHGQAHLLLDDTTEAYL